MNSYGMSKEVNEVAAVAFQRRSGADVYAPRIGNVMVPQDQARFADFAKDPRSRRRITFSYIDARELGQIVNLVLMKAGLGFQVFNAVNDTNSVPQPNGELLAQFFPGVEMIRPEG